VKHPPISESREVRAYHLNQHQAHCQRPMVASVVYCGCEPPTAKVLVCRWCGWPLLLAARWVWCACAEAMWQAGKAA
jgi:hypothetical protein